MRKNINTIPQIATSGNLRKGEIMRTSIDIVNYFSRAVRRKELRYLKKMLHKKVFYKRLQPSIRELKLKRQLTTLLKCLQNVPKYCALKDPRIIKSRHPIPSFRFCKPLCTNEEENSTNLNYARVIVRYYKMENLIHFRLETTEGMWMYQYSIEGLRIQPIETLIQEVAYMLTKAWIKVVKKGDKNEYNNSQR